jgi:NADH-quinone oxidoreductase subunit N
VSPDYAGLFNALRPEVALVLGALVALALDLSVFRRHSDGERLRLALWVGALAVLAAGVPAWLGAYHPAGPVFGGVLILDPLACATRLGVLVLTLLTLGVAWGGARPRQPAEYVAVLLFAATGLLLIAAAQQLLLAFVALELASLSLYVLAGFDLRSRESAEAALKYFLFGAMAAAFLLFGFSLIYGLTGSIELPEIAEQISLQGTNPLLLVAIVMVLVAFGFKVAAAPFHLWAPDVYQGAPAPSAALIASASKLAGFTLFTRLLWPGFHAAAGSAAVFRGGPGWLPAVAVLAGASLLLGNLAALAQSSLRRLLAYSAIAHAGALLLGVMAVGVAGPGPLFYYASTYGLAAVGAFGVVSAAERGGRCESISDLAGLHKRSPLLAGCLAVFILSLAGIPPLAGFFGKLFVYMAALRLGGLAGPAGWLVILAIALSAVALYYYLIVLKQALVADPAPDAPPIRVPIVTALALAAAAGLILWFGLEPERILGLF